MFEDTWHAQTALIFPAREGWGPGGYQRTHMYTRALVYRCKCRSTRRAIHSIRAYGALNSDGAGGLDGTHFACVSTSACISCVMVRRSLGSRESESPSEIAACMYRVYTHTHRCLCNPATAWPGVFVSKIKTYGRSKRTACACVLLPLYIDVTTPSPASALPRKKSTQSGL